jgi:hypothetical protein
MTPEILNEPFIVDFEDGDETRPVRHKRARRPSAKCWRRGR